jgi:hypothetical protein
MSVPSRIHLPFTHLSTNDVCDKAYIDTVMCRFPATLQGDPETIFSYTTDILRPFNICHCTFTPLSILAITEVHIAGHTINCSDIGNGCVFYFSRSLSPFDLFGMILIPIIVRAVDDSISLLPSAV